MQTDVLVEVQHLKTYFTLNEGLVRAVDDVSFEIQRGRTLGLVGESGCGKSVTSLSLLQLVRPPGKIVDGNILYHRSRNGQDNSIDIANLDPESPQMRQIRGAEIAMVFQEPMTSLDPVYTVGNQIMEGISFHHNVTKREARDRAIEILRRVNMPQPHQIVDSYPHQLSGGMRQRAMIAMALSCHPSLLIADEPTTALDVTTEAQILELMNELQEELGMAILYITHNLGVIAEMVEEAVVMYLGKVVECASVNDLFHNPKHPYLQALLHSIPKIGTKSRTRLDAITGMVPNPHNIPRGCTFHPRCQNFMPGTCDVAEPRITDVGEGHLVSCFLYHENQEKNE